MEDYRIRVRIFVVIILAVLGVLGLRLAQLQLIESQEYTGESRSNAIRERRVQPARGVVYDRNGRLVVGNEPSYTVTLTPRHFDTTKVDLLAGLLAMPDSLVRAKLAEARRWSAFRPSPSFREVPFDAFSRVQENRYRLPGVGYEITQKRYYATEARAAHALGYVREITGGELETKRTDGYRAGDVLGKAGLERQYESYLRGRVGREFKLVNVRGLEVKSYLDGAEDTPPVSGYDLHLTIDSRVQALAESLFVNKRGGAVAMDPHTGEILAMVSSPDFDPDVFSRSIPPELWAYLTESEEKPMFNRATMSGMPPGSTWKPFMSLLGLSEGIITENSTIYCPGGYLLGGRLFKCHGGAHGAISVKRAIQVSCNTFFFTVMMRTDVDTFKEYATRFGFGQKAPMDIAEQAAGIIPDSSYFDYHYGEGGWTAGYTINLGIGQGDMVVTPMQLARYIAAVANSGTLPTPHLVRALTQPETNETLRPDLPEAEQVGIDPAYFQIVREGMKLVMEAGTGRGVQIPGITSGGKTGTAQAPGGREDHSVFVMFAPWDDPEIAVAVMVENGGFGATQAAPIASLMVEQYLTGKIADAPRRQYLIDRLMNLRSEPLPDPEGDG